MGVIYIRGEKLKNKLVHNMPTKYGGTLCNYR